MRLRIDAFQMCPLLHFQSFFCAVPATTVDGSHSYASAAISGNLVLRSLNPTNTCILEQTGQPVPPLDVLFSSSVIAMG